jgi:hypothetical protein
MHKVMIVDDKEPTDKYGRTLAVVHCGGVHVNRELLRRGYADVMYTSRPQSSIPTRGVRIKNTAVSINGLCVCEAPKSMEVSEANRKCAVRRTC